MNYLIENWYLFIGILALVAVLIYACIKFAKLPNGKQMTKIKEWLLYIVVKAEQELGEKTGKIKLAYTYDLFIARFKWMSVFITFDMFSILVDEALEEMKKMLESNKAVRVLVEGENKVKK